MVGGSWRVTASQYPARVNISLQLGRYKGPVFTHSLYTLSLSCAMMTVHCKTEGVKSKNENLSPCSNLQLTQHHCGLGPLLSLRINIAHSTSLKITNIIAEGHKLINFILKFSLTPVFLLII